MKIGQFLTYDIWRISMIGMSRWKRLSIQVIKVLVMFHDGFNSKRLNLIAQGLGHEEFAIYCFINIIQHIGHNKHPFYRLVAAAKCTGSCNFPIKIFIHSVYRILYHIIEKKARGKSHFFLDKS